MPNSRILCVDDDLTHLAVISDVLRKEGYQVDTAPGGKQGLVKAQSWKPDLIVLDAVMPEMDGYEMCRHLNESEDTDKIGVLMLTPKGAVEEPGTEPYKIARNVKDQMKSFDSGALEFLTKPVTAKDLVQKVKAVLWASGF